MNGKYFPPAPVPPIEIDSSNPSTLHTTPSTTKSETSPVAQLSPCYTKQIMHGHDANLDPPTRGRHGAVYSTPNMSQYIKQLNLSPQKNTTLQASTHSMNDIDLNSHSAGILIQSNRGKPRGKIRKANSLRHITRSISRGNLLNTARSLSTVSSKAMIKIKHKHSDEMYHDSFDVKQSKANLESISAMSKIVQASKKLHAVQLQRLKMMREFSHTIHSTIDLGRARKHGQKNENYFGQYLKMMASTTHNVAQLYSEYNDKFMKYFIEPLEGFKRDETGEVQECKNLKYEYQQRKNMFNNNSSSKHRLELEDIREAFVSQTNKLIKHRHDKIKNEWQIFEKCSREYARNKSQYIQSKRLINGYDEMKEKKRKTQYQIKNEIRNINNSSELQQYIRNSEKSSIIFFHRNKFPPSMKFLTECVAPLCSTYNAIQFLIVHHNCRELLQQYDINVFPSCLLFVGNKVSHQHQPIIGNSAETREQLQFICKQIDDNNNNNDDDDDKNEIEIEPDF